MIILKNVSFRYDEKEVIKNCSLSVSPHEVHLVVGPNGAGKTTLIMLLKGLIKPFHGRVAPPSQSCSRFEKHRNCVYERLLLKLIAPYTNHSTLF